MTIATKRKILRRAITVNCGVAVGCVVVVCLASASGQGVGDVYQASKLLSESAEIDVTRLALQVASLSIVANVAMVAWMIRSVGKWASKPCVLDNHMVSRMIVRMASKDDA